MRHVPQCRGSHGCCLLVALGKNVGKSEPSLRKWNARIARIEPQCPLKELSRIQADPHGRIRFGTPGKKVVGIDIYRAIEVNKNSLPYGERQGPTPTPPPRAPRIVLVELQRAPCQAFGLRHLTALECTPFPRYALMIAACRIGKRQGKFGSRAIARWKASRAFPLASLDIT